MAALWSLAPLDSTSQPASTATARKEVEEQNNKNDFVNLNMRI